MMSFKKLKVLILPLFILLLFGHYINSEHSATASQQNAFVPLTPFDIVDEYHRALAARDWDKVQDYVTPALWGYMTSSGFIEDWEEISAENEGLEFVMFLVSSQRIDDRAGESWVLGKVHWRSETGKLKNYSLKVLLTRTSQGWKIKEIRDFSPIQVVDDFYQSITNQDWDQFRTLLTPDYYNKLNQAGIINALQREREQFEGETYVFFLVSDFTQGQDKAYITGDVGWKPLSMEFAEAPVKIRVLRRGNNWLIDNVQGHWDISK